MRFVLARHSITQWNLEDRLQGQTDVPLHPEGVKQAHNLATELIGAKITSIVSSPLLRAKHTAEIVQSYLEVSLRLDTRLRECSFGSLEGLTVDKIEQIHGTAIADQIRGQISDYDFSPFGGEGHTSVARRHLEVLDEYKNLCPHEIILIVGHGRGLTTTLHQLGDLQQLIQGKFCFIEY